MGPGEPKAEPVQVASAMVGLVVKYRWNPQQIGTWTSKYMVYSVHSAMYLGGATSDCTWLSQDASLNKPNETHLALLNPETAFHHIHLGEIFQRWAIEAIAILGCPMGKVKRLLDPQLNRAVACSARTASTKQSLPLAR